MMINIIIAGPPGSGKGTQAKEMVEAFGFVHLSTGDMLRREIQAQSELGKEVESIMARGDLVSDDIVIRLISENVKKNPGVKGFLYDGFPRTIAQAEALDAFLEKLGHPLDLMLVLDVDDKLCEERLLRRAAIENRADDMDAGRVRHRLATYHTQTEPLIEHYQRLGKCCHVEGATGVETTFKQIKECLNPIL